jgi:hypothetical protein
VALAAELRPNPIRREYVFRSAGPNHREAHRASREIAWWQSHGIAPLAAAEALRSKSQSGQATRDFEPASPEPPNREAARPHCNARLETPRVW